MEKLVLKYVHGELSEKERLELNTWLQESGENRIFFENFVSHWNLSPLDIELSKIKVWQKLSDRRINVKPSKVSWYGRNVTLLKVAACIILIAGIFAASLVVIDFSAREQRTLANTQNRSFITKRAEKGQKKTIQLPDGTIVKLNADTEISFPEAFEKRSRVVQLNGEAFFDVVRDEKRPFIIHAGKIEVKVLGTSFNVNSYARSNDVSVAVRSGKVAIHDTGKTVETVLIKDEKLSLSDKDNSFKKERIKDPEMVYGWVDNFLSFDELKLEDAMSVVSKWYGVSYRIDAQNFTDKKITAKFKNPTLKNVMENMSHSYGFKYEINKDYVVVQ